MNATIALVRCSIELVSDCFFQFDFTLAEANQLRRSNKELEENLARNEQRFNQLQKTLTSFEEGLLNRDETVASLSFIPFSNIHSDYFAYR